MQSKRIKLLKGVIFLKGRLIQWVCSFSRQADKLFKVLIGLLSSFLIRI